MNEAEDMDAVFTSVALRAAAEQELARVPERYRSAVQEIVEQLVPVIQDRRRFFSQPQALAHALRYMAAVYETEAQLKALPPTATV